MGTDIDLDASEIDDVVDNLASLMETVPSNGQSIQDDLADDMIEFIEESIRLNFEDVRTKENQTSLLDAFKAFPNGDSVLITTSWSDADHARPLESGNPPHEIWPSDGKALAFQPENIDKYKEELQVGGGYVRMGKVDWKPSGQSAAGYGYVRQAQEAWDEQAGFKSSDAVKRAIREAGFNRS